MSTLDEQPKNSQESFCKLISQLRTCSMSFRYLLCDAFVSHEAIKTSMEAPKPRTNIDEKCSIQILNLYRHLNGELQHRSSRFIIKEVLATEKCEMYDLVDIRERTKEKMLQRAKVTPADDSPAARAAALETALGNDAACDKVREHYHTWYEDNVLKVLPWPQRAHYYFERHSTKFLLVGAVAVGVRVGVSYKSGLVAAWTTLLLGTLWNIKPARLDQRRKWTTLTY